MGMFFALLALCEGILQATGGFPLQRPATRRFDIFFWYAPQQTAEQTIKMPVICDTITLSITSL